MRKQRVLASIYGPQAQANEQAERDERRRLKKEKKKSRKRKASEGEQDESAAEDDDEGAAAAVQGHEDSKAGSPEAKRSRLSESSEDAARSTADGSVKHDMEDGAERKDGDKKKKDKKDKKDKKKGKKKDKHAGAAAGAPVRAKDKKALKTVDAARLAAYRSAVATSKRGSKNRRRE